MGLFAAECDAVGMRVSNAKSEVMVLCPEMVDSSYLVEGWTLPHVRVFKYLLACSGVMRKVEHEMYK